MHIFAHICIYARIYACIYAYMCAYMHMLAHMHICSHICIYARIYAYMRAFMHTRAPGIVCFINPDLANTNIRFQLEKNEHGSTHTHTLNTPFTLTSTNTLYLTFSLSHTSFTRLICELACCVCACVYRWVDGNCEEVPSLP